MFHCWVKEEGQKEITVVTIWIEGACVRVQGKLKKQNMKCSNAL